ncbi:GH25 family lysozyme [Ligilactobacillus saerimneri]|nr:GH25 family lysozyme [Ligilactobacillus saerimneri]
MMNREMVIDLASPYQTMLTANDYRKIGAKKAIIKISEGTTYTNPDIRLLINRSAEGGVSGYSFYHFGRFRNDSQAVAEAKYFLEQARKTVNPQPGTLMILDAEIENMPTSSVIAFLKTLRAAGFKTGFYSYLYLLPEFNLDAILQHADFFWLAAYPLGDKPADKSPDFHYFPSAQKVDAWQFTPKLLGYNLDGSITVTENANQLLSGSTPVAVKPAPETQQKQTDSWVDDLGVKWYKETGQFTITDSSGIWLRWGATTRSAKIAALPQGAVIKYDAYCYSGGYVWIRQPRGGGQFGYLPTGREVNGKRQDYWGIFK